MMTPSTEALADQCMCPQASKEGRYVTSSCPICLEDFTPDTPEPSEPPPATATAVLTSCGSGFQNSEEPPRLVPSAVQEPLLPPHDLSHADSTAAAFSQHLPPVIEEDTDNTYTPAAMPKAIDGSSAAAAANGFGTDVALAGSAASTAAAGADTSAAPGGVLRTGDACTGASCAMLAVADPAVVSPCPPGNSGIDPPVAEPPSALEEAPGEVPAASPCAAGRSPDCAVHSPAPAIDSSAGPGANDAEFEAPESEVREPWTLRCGHVFCRACVTAWLEHHSDCPSAAHLQHQPCVALHCRSSVLMNVHASSVESSPQTRAVAL